MTAYLLDTHVLLGLFRLTDYEIPEFLFPAIEGPVEKFASAASMWEAAIKWRTGRLQLRQGPAALPGLCNEFEIGIVDVSAQDSLHELETWPATKDPFDRMLLAQCAVRGWRLLTSDDGLIDHPLAWR
jgi:PIN domain nuclease of toxin-antitoxin system